MVRVNIVCTLFAMVFVYGIVGFWDIRSVISERFFMKVKL